MRKHLSLVAAAAGIGSSCFVASPPDASLPAVKSPSEPLQVPSDSVVDSGCVTALTGAGADSSQIETVCTSTPALGVSVPRVSSDVEIASAAAIMTPTDAARLVSAQVAGAVHSKAYPYTKTNVSDRERIAGTFYYDGSHAWVKTAYRGYTGSLHCSVDWSVGISVSSASCSESGFTSKRQLAAVWKFSVGVKGGPVAWSESQTMYVSAYGSVKK